MNKQEFIINTLKPYFLDKSLCGYDADSDCCRYRAGDKKCAVGKYIPDEVYAEWMELKVLEDLLPYLSEEARTAELRVDEWIAIRSVHDGLAKMYSKGDTLAGIAYLEAMTKTNLSELRELVN